MRVGHERSSRERRAAWTGPEYRTRLYMVPLGRPERNGPDYEARDLLIVRFRRCVLDLVPGVLVGRLLLDYRVRYQLQTR